MNFVKNMIRKIFRLPYRILVKPFLQYVWRRWLRKRFYNMFIREALQKGDLLFPGSYVPSSLKNHMIDHSQAYLDSMRLLLNDRLSYEKK